MENWGLVTYRETTLLIDPAQSSASAKQTVALVVGHELAHQWFGNFVTMVRRHFFAMDSTVNSCLLDLCKAAYGVLVPSFLTVSCFFPTCM